MPKILHITNGDVAADTLSATSLGGDVLPWRDPMHHGPFPGGLDLDAASKLRAQYLGTMTGNTPDVERDFQRRNDMLLAACGYEEVILWFEHDLLDQLQILQLLDWFAAPEMRPERLTMICIDAFPAIEPFYGLGQLETDQMAALFDRRAPVTAAQIECAQAGWRAFRASAPSEVNSFLMGELSPLPFLHAALDRHLEEFPWSTDGLTRTERQILRLVADGVTGPGEIFAANMALENALFIGDWATFERIAKLCAGPRPLLATADGAPFRHPPVTAMPRKRFLAQRLALTGDGKEILAADGTRPSIPIARDEWRGGVHLATGQPMWTWDPEGRSFLRIEP